MTTSNRRSRDDFGRIKKDLDYVPGKAMHVDCWKSLTISYSRGHVCTKHYKINSAVKLLFSLCDLSWNCQHFSA